MNRFRSKRGVFVLVVLLVGMLLVIDLEARPRLAPGQAPLANISNIEDLRTQFNRDIGQTRLIILVSPT